MNITTKDIIKLVITDDKVRHDMLAHFDELDTIQKGNVINMLWEAYDMVYSSLLEQNTQEGLLAITDGNEQPGPDFFLRMREKTDSQIEKQMIDGQTTVDLEEARKAMELIVREMQAAKKAKAH